jgi:hypothetical protein
MRVSSCPAHGHREQVEAGVEVVGPEDEVAGADRGDGPA